MNLSSASHNLVIVVVLVVVTVVMGYETGTTYGR